MAKPRSPTCLTWMPSAMVWPPGTALWPRMRAVNEGKLAGSTPKMLMSGLRCLAAVATPAIRPPPPIGTGRISRSGASSSISSAMVPWPAITSMSLNGCTKISARSSCRRSAVA